MHPGVSLLDHGLHASLSPAALPSLAGEASKEEGSGEQTTVIQNNLGFTSSLPVF